MRFYAKWFVPKGADSLSLFSFLSVSIQSVAGYGSNKVVTTHEQFEA